MKVILRIAAVQAEASTGGVDHNIAKAVDFIQRASAEKVDVIVFPEAFVTGYDDAAFTGPLPASKDLDWLDPVQQAVDETGMLVVLNTALDRGGSSTLTDIVLAPGSGPVLAYDKQHLYDSERRWFTAGDHGCSLSAGDLKLGLSVCYDANFPEHAAEAAVNGAIVYINSGAYFPGGEHRRDLCTMPPEHSTTACTSYSVASSEAPISSSADPPCLTRLVNVSLTFPPPRAWP